MLLLLILLGLLQHYFWGFVCASPVKDLTSPRSETGESSHSSRYSPYKVNPVNGYLGSYKCSNGHVIQQRILMDSVKVLCPRINHLRQMKFATPIASNPGYQTYDYPLLASGNLWNPMRDQKSEYKIRIHQNLKDFSKCSLAAVYSVSGQLSRQCIFTALSSKGINQPQIPQLGQTRSQAINSRYKKFLDCNGKLFYPDFIFDTLRYARNILHKQMTKLQLSSSENDGYPRPFVQKSFPHKDVWMFPLLADGKTFYVDGDPGPYFVVMKNTGKLVGSFYRKDANQVMREMAAATPSKSSNPVDDFAPCRLRENPPIRIS